MRGGAEASEPDRAAQSGAGGRTASERKILKIR